MGRITDLTILEEFTSFDITFGFYWCKFNGSRKLFTRNGDMFAVVTHQIDCDKLERIRDDVRDELLEAIKELKTK